MKKRAHLHERSNFHENMQLPTLEPPVMQQDARAYPVEYSAARLVTRNQQPGNFEIVAPSTHKCEEHSYSKEGPAGHSSLKGQQFAGYPE